MSERSIQNSIDRSRCVLCGGPNDCALAGPDRQGDEPCWCVRQSFPVNLLETATAEDGGESCVCRKCLEDGQAGANPPVTS